MTDALLKTSQHQYHSLASVVQEGEDPKTYSQSFADVRKLALQICMFLAKESGALTQIPTYTICPADIIVKIKLQMTHVKEENIEDDVDGSFKKLMSECDLTQTHCTDLEAFIRFDDRFFLLEDENCISNNRQVLILRKAIKDIPTPKNSDDFSVITKGKLALYTKPKEREKRVLAISRTAWKALQYVLEHWQADPVVQATKLSKTKRTICCVVL